MVRLLPLFVLPVCRLREPAMGWRVKRVHDEGGDEVRVLVQGGVYQSASYVGERWAEPVFAYYRAFDDVFEAEDAMRDAYGHGINRMLMLGGGGFAYPKFALMSRELAHGRH